MLLRCLIRPSLRDEKQRSFLFSRADLLNRTDPDDQFTVTSSSGIRDRDTRVAEIVTRELEWAKPDKWAYVQTRELWSPKGERQVHPGHFWMLKFGKVPGSKSCVQKEFELGDRKCEEYKGLRFRHFCLRAVILDYLLIGFLRATETLRKN